MRASVKDLQLISGVPYSYLSHSSLHFSEWFLLLSIICLQEKVTNKALGLLRHDILPEETEVSPWRVSEPPRWRWLSSSVWGCRRFSPRSSRLGRRCWFLAAQSRSSVAPQPAAPRLHTTIGILLSWYLRPLSVLKSDIIMTRLQFVKPVLTYLSSAEENIFPVLCQIRCQANCKEMSQFFLALLLFHEYELQTLFLLHAPGLNMDKSS